MKRKKVRIDRNDIDRFRRPNEYAVEVFIPNSFLFSHRYVLRKEIYPVDVVLSKVIVGVGKKVSVPVKFDGDIIDLASKRYQMYKTKGIKCVKCGIEGVFFAKERDKNAQNYHLSLYAIDKDYNEVQMTKDHKLPACKGGSGELDNFQPMCHRCNYDKSLTVPDNADLKNLRHGLYRNMATDKKILIFGGVINDDTQEMMVLYKNINDVNDQFHCMTQRGFFAHAITDGSSYPLHSFIECKKLTVRVKVEDILMGGTSRA